jgi:hypothetical protein
MLITSLLIDGDAQQPPCPPAELIGDFPPSDGHTSLGQYHTLDLASSGAQQWSGNDLSVSRPPTRSDTQPMAILATTAQIHHQQQPAPAPPRQRDATPASNPNSRRTSLDPASRVYSLSQTPTPIGRVRAASQLPCQPQAPRGRSSTPISRSSTPFTTPAPTRQNRRPLQIPPTLTYQVQPGARATTPFSGSRATTPFAEHTLSHTRRQSLHPPPSSMAGRTHTAPASRAATPRALPTGPSAGYRLPDTPPAIGNRSQSRSISNPPFASNRASTPSTPLPRSSRPLPPLLSAASSVPTSRLGTHFPSASGPRPVGPRLVGSRPVGSPVSPPRSPITSTPVSLQHSQGPATPLQHSTGNDDCAEFDLGETSVLERELGSDGLESNRFGNGNSNPRHRRVRTPPPITRAFNRVVVSASDEQTPNSDDIYDLPADTFHVQLVPSVMHLAPTTPEFIARRAKEIRDIQGARKCKHQEADDSFKGAKQLKHYPEEQQGVVFVMRASLQHTYVARSPWWQDEEVIVGRAKEFASKYTSHPVDDFATEGFVKIVSVLFLRLCYEPDDFARS